MCWHSFWGLLLDPVLSLGFIMVGANIYILLLQGKRVKSVFDIFLSNLHLRKSGTKLYSVRFLSYYFWVVAFVYCTLFFTDALMEYTKGEFAVTGENATANIFASYPAKHLSVLNGFLDQVGFKTNYKCMSSFPW